MRYIEFYRKIDFEADTVPHIAYFNKLNEDDDFRYILANADKK